MKWRTWLFVFLTTFLMGVQNGYTKQVDSAAKFNPRTQVPTSEEGIVILNLPIELVKREAIKALTAQGTQISKVYRLDFDPIERLVILDVQAELPVDILNDMNEIAGNDHSIKASHRISISFKLPTAKKLALTRYFSMEVVEFKLDGHSYLNALHRVYQYCVGLLVNTSFMNYMLNDKPDMELTEDNLALQIKQMIEKKGLRFRDRSISFKLDLTMIPQLKDFAELTELRVWQVNPVVVKGTKDMIALRIEAGIGRPSKTWLTDTKKRSENDSRGLKEVRAEFYAKYAYSKEVVAEFSALIDETKNQMAFTQLGIKGENDIKTLKGHVESRAREALNLKNPLFEAAPEDTFEFFKRDTKEYIIDFLSDLKTKNLLDNKIKNGGSKSNALPFLSKRLSQATMDQATRFFRDFEFNNEQMLPEVSLVFDPRLPGVIVRGVMNMDINFLMEMGMEGSGIQWGKTPWRAAEDVWGAGLPFEISLRMKMLDDGWLGLDVDNFSILTGVEKVYLSPKTGHGKVMANWVKMAIVNTMATFLLDQSEVVEDQEPVDSYVLIRNKMKKQLESYRQMVQSELSLEQLIKLASIDIDSNPFLLAGKETVAGKAEMFFKDLIKYDEESGLILFKVDPKLATETILASENTVQLWNLEPVYDEKMNQVYIDLAVGNKTRSHKYIQQIFNRPEYNASQSFVGIDETKAISPRDLQVKMDLNSMQKLINQILADAYNQQKADVLAALRKDEESSHYLVKDLSLVVIRDGVLQMNAILAHESKSKRGWYNPARWVGDTFVTSSETINFNAALSLSVEKLSKYKNRISLAPNEVFLGNELLKIDLVSAGFKFGGKVGVLKKIVGAAFGNVNFKKNGVAKWAKKLIIKFAKGYLNETNPKKNGNTELAGVKINKYAKLLAHDEELLIQLNPHIGGPAFEMRLLPTQKFQGVDLGLILKKSNNSMSMDFSTTGNMAAVDKGELLRVMKKSIDLFKPYLDANSSEEIEALLLKGFVADQTFYNSDYKKLSLMHRLSKVMGQYTGILDVIKPDMSVINTINQQLNSTFGIPTRTVNGRRLTLSGVELMYVASASALLKNRMDAFISKVERLVPGAKGLDYFREKSQELEERYIRPLLDTYKKRFLGHNTKIVNKGPTDWNFTYYPDAMFSNAAYNRINEAL